jgi:hypothetical protein
VRGRVLVLLSLTLSSLLAACGGSGGDSATTKTTARASDCAMTAAAARAIQERLVAMPLRKASSAEVIMHELTQAEASTSTDRSPDGRDAFILVNEASAGLAGLRGTTGSRSVSLKARRGCGAVAYLPHSGPSGAQFTLNGQDAGGVGPAADS